MFTHRAYRPSVRPRDFVKAESGGQPCEATRRHRRLKPLGVVNTGNVIRNDCKIMLKDMLQKLDFKSNY